MRDMSQSVSSGTAFLDLWKRRCLGEPRDDYARLSWLLPMVKGPLVWVMGEQWVYLTRTPARLFTSTPNIFSFQGQTGWRDGSMGTLIISKKRKSKILLLGWMNPLNWHSLGKFWLGYSSAEKFLHSKYQEKCTFGIGLYKYIFTKHERKCHHLACSCPWSMTKIMRIYITVLKMKTSYTVVTQVSFLCIFQL